MRLHVVEGSLSESPSPIVNPDLTQDEDEEQSDIIVGLIAAS